MQKFTEQIIAKNKEINNWLSLKEKELGELPLYSSVDIRDAGFKTAIVDTNLFPAGFNNLCEHGTSVSVAALKSAILKRVPHCKNILIVAEEHTRNTWYLENIRTLQSLIEQAGFTARTTTFLYIQPVFCEDATYIELTTATGQPLTIFCFQKILKDMKAGKIHFDLIIMNNDLTEGIPELLKYADAPIYPPMQAGWHSRLKSDHFRYANELLTELASVIDIDPWLISCLNTTVDSVNINLDDDRRKLTDATENIFEKIREKYKQHNIKETPFIFIKADSGTYGMGVLPIRDPADIAALNRRNRNKLYKGKGSQVIARYLLQEGVPTTCKIDGKVSEPCLYQVDNRFIGAFYRLHGEKTVYENLNSPGMEFRPLCPDHEHFKSCGTNYDDNIFSLYQILARVAGIAAQKEIIQLEASIK
ncbi:MAG: glutamate--cysteine ligase [Candidatus Omnitrophota bacterium]